MIRFKEKYRYLSEEHQKIFKIYGTTKGTTHFTAFFLIYFNGKFQWFSDDHFEPLPEDVPSKLFHLV